MCSIVRLNTGAVIPAYNVGEKLQNVLSKTAKYIVRRHIIVVDDGSADNTASIAREFGVCLISHGFNRGKGAALLSGFSAAVSLKLDAVITLDGDGQHDPDRIPHFIREYESSQADLVLGKRPFRIGKMPFDRILSNRISSFIVSVASGQSVADSQCGYRLLRVQMINALNLKSNGYELESELLIRALRRGFRLAYCPVPAVYNGAESHIRRSRDIMRFCRMILHLFGERN